MRSILLNACTILLPGKRDSSVTDRLRRAKTFELIPAMIDIIERVGLRPLRRTIGGQLFSLYHFYFKLIHVRVVRMPANKTRHEN